MLSRKVISHGSNYCACDGLRLPRRSSRGSDLVAGALAIGLWIVVPKCPVCVAAHVALWTGVGLSFAAANYVRWSLLGCCATVLVCTGRRLIARSLSALANRFPS